MNIHSSKRVHRFPNTYQTICTSYKSCTFADISYLRVRKVICLDIELFLLATWALNGWHSLRMSISMGFLFHFNTGLQVRYMCGICSLHLFTSKQFPAATEPLISVDVPYVVTNTCLLNFTCHNPECHVCISLPHFMLAAPLIPAIPVVTTANCYQAILSLWVTNSHGCC